MAAHLVLPEADDNHWQPSLRCDFVLHLVQAPCMLFGWLSGGRWGRFW
jgi:hypothetical protein